MQASPLHLYVHIPFCVHKCHYCDFNSHERRHPPWVDYQAALIAEIEHYAKSPAFAERQLDTIFFGGGTPSLAPPTLIAAVIASANRHFGLSEHCEISLEANPGTADAEHFLGYLQAGVNRLSIGVQSMDDDELAWLGRIHNRTQAMQTYQLARDVGFTNINLDLIYGLPNQDLSKWLSSLMEAIAMAPEHFSCYQLTVEPHTSLAANHRKRPYPLPDDELALTLFTATRQILLDAGYRAYEISNFAKPEMECRHNDGYWLYHDYIGIGAGAAGKWDTPDGGTKRYCNVRSPERYIQTALSGESAFQSQEDLSLEQAAAEAVWLGLRRSHGIGRSEFKLRFGFDAWEQFASALQQWQTGGRLAVLDGSIHLTPEGVTLADAIAASVL